MSNRVHLQRKLIPFLVRRFCQEVDTSVDLEPQVDKPWFQDFSSHIRRGRNKCPVRHSVLLLLVRNSYTDHKINCGHRNNFEDSPAAIDPRVEVTFYHQEDN